MLFSLLSPTNFGGVTHILSKNWVLQTEIGAIRDLSREHG